MAGTAEARVAVRVGEETAAARAAVGWEAARVAARAARPATAGGLCGVNARLNRCLQAEVQKDAPGKQKHRRWKPLTPVPEVAPQACPGHVLKLPPQASSPWHGLEMPHM